MNKILFNTDALAARARNLGALNGIDFGIVALDTASPPGFATLEVHFYNDQSLAALVTAAATPAEIWSLVPVRGGERIIGGPLAGQVQVVSLTHSAANVIQFKISPVGDYSRYRLKIHDPGFDPVFSGLEFRFRPGCFNTNCQPQTAYAPAVVQPAIDYLAKDYESFRHTIIAAMMQRVPNWQAATEAQFDVVLLDLFSAAADELSNYQDRVMQEAYWATAQKRISLRRHARLMSYYPYEGNQASTTLALNFPGPASYTIPAWTRACTGAWTVPAQPNAVIFVTAEASYIDAAFSSVPLYTWSDAIPALAKGATSADLAYSSAAGASLAAGLVTPGKIQRLLVQEWLNPATGRPAGANPNKRQILHLTKAEALTDPLTGDALVRVHWGEADALTDAYCFVVDVNGLRVTGVSLFHGNLVDVVQGAPQSLNYLSPGMPAPPGGYNYQLNAAGAAECRLPPALPVLWSKTPNPFYQAPVSTVQVEVIDASGNTQWSEAPDLIRSESTDTNFVVETDENLRTLLRFGDGTNGAALSNDATVTISWLSGYGPDGNVGKDTVSGFDPAAGVANGTVWNPFDVTDGTAPQSADVIRRSVPEAFLYNQERAVTLADYVARAEEIAGVARAEAQYAWTGSWRTVRVCIDLAGTTTLSEGLRATVEAALDAVHLIGEDVEVRTPEYVPLVIALDICIAGDHWIEDVAPVIEQAFGNGYTADGEMAFFNPDRWTFGQPLYASQIEGVLTAIQGVGHLVSISMARWWNQNVTSSTVLTMGPIEIVLLSNDPSRMEDGIMTFSYQGGRQ